VRVAVVDIGSNSTRLLIADLDPASGAVEEVLRRSEVTRLGEGLDASGSLAEHAIERVMSTLADYRGAIQSHGVGVNIALLTAAVREAANGEAFAARVRDEFQLDAHVLTGEEEARLTFLGATADQPGEERGNAREPTVVIDIGGGSTEFVIGRGRVAGFHTSLPVGVVRMSERRIRSDPPVPEELDSLAQDVRATFQRNLPAEERASVTRAIAVAGTATSAAAIDQRLEPYDPARVHGYMLSLAAVDEMIARVAAMNEAERRSLAGLHPDRAPTIVAGLIILGEALRAFELDAVTVSEHDILYGGALRLAGLG
jgi:exopolyphosphatase / guanosine-5'-triphosphate,3'-diphosphate pyrophosphatase